LLAPIGSALPLLDVYPIVVLLVVLVAGILLPIWAVWLASRAREIWPSADLAAETLAGEPSPGRDNRA